MARSPKKQLAYPEWPQEDRQRWEDAFATGNPFDGQGLGAHLAEASQRALKGAYGRFLGFMMLEHRASFSQAPAARLTADRLKEYVEYMGVSRTASGIATELHHLSLALKLIRPGEDWSWLLQITKRIAARRAGKPRKKPPVTTEQLYALGLALMDDVVGSLAFGSALSKSEALKYRDGLIIALLAGTPLRRRSLAALRIETHLVKSGHQWELNIPAKDAKNRRAIEYPISDALSGRVDIYLEKVRSLIPGATTHNGFWASNKGQAMDHGAIYDTVCKRTREAFGFPVNLHRFRSAAGNLWSIHDPANVRGLKDVLGHATFQPTEKYYIQAQSRIAGRALALAIAKTK